MIGQSKKPSPLPIEPPAELTRRLERARRQRRHFDETMPGIRTTWHEVVENLELELAAWKEAQKNKENLDDGKPDA